MSRKVSKKKEHISEADLYREILRYQRIFLHYNRTRIQEMFHLLPESYRDPVCAIPYLLNWNVPGLPGYIRNPLTPTGVYNFGLNQEGFIILKKMFPYVDIPKQLSFKKPVFESVFAFGSCGTIAQGEASDIDYWLCFNAHQYSAKEIDLLNQKIERIKEWIDHFKGLEIHFFLMDVNQIKKNDFGQISQEGCGSAQGKLLKEEFYRTAIRIAGRIPFWWITPPETSQERYKKVKRLVQRDEGLLSEGYIDFGIFSSISPDEYFGGAIWQITKSLHFPFKSVLKMGQMAEYLGNSKLLCEEFKREVFHVIVKGGFVDPYVLLIDKVLDFYEAKKDIKTVDLLRKCFYLKVDTKLTQIGTPMAHQREKINIISNYVAQWGWDTEQLLELDMIDTWGLEKIQKFQKEINAYLLETYKELSQNFSRLTVKHKINEADLTIIGRKLSSFYAQKKNKVLRLNTTYIKEMSKKDFHVVYKNGSDGDYEWRLYTVSTFPRKKTESEMTLVKKSRHLVEILLWLAFSNLYEVTTNVTLNPNPTRVTAVNIHQLLKAFNKFCSYIDIDSIDVPLLFQSAKVMKAFLIINLGECKEEKLLPKSPLYQTYIEDIFSSDDNFYKSICEISIIYFNSWGELFCKKYEKDNMLAKVLIDLSVNHIGLDNIAFFAPKNRYKTRVVNRLEKLIQEFLDFFGSEILQKQSHKRFITIENDSFIIISLKKGNFEYQSFSTRNDLFKALNDTRKVFAETHFDTSIRENQL